MKSLLSNICIFGSAALYLFFFFPICESAARLATKLLSML